jgi:hypothetical protein
LYISVKLTSWFFIHVVKISRASAAVIGDTSVGASVAIAVIAAVVTAISIVADGVVMVVAIVAV